MAGIKKGSGRWATIVKDTGEVSSVAAMEGDVPPETRNVSKDQFELIEVDEDVMIGMVRSGKGFEWPAGREGENHSGIGATRIGGAVGDGTDKSRGNTAPPEAKEEKPTPQPEEMKLKPAPSAPGGTGAGHAPVDKRPDVQPVAKPAVGERVK